MAKFMTRIELHDADSNDYETLHLEMQKKGFDKTIKDNVNKEYHLPNGEYYFNKPIQVHLTKDDYEIVLEKAISAAEKTKKEFSIITSRTDVINWYKLEPVN
jgi:hypothetical protein